ncbi:MAG: hypothetical protein JSV42_18305 [Chloroflexota bacterium]|nr:MAG: hypothetical protein JSV42_18305 [Chloroflexota bacterium]
MTSMFSKWSLRILFSLLTFSLIIFIWWLIPQAKSIFFQIQGGQLLDEAIQSAPDFNNESLLCSLEPTRDRNSYELATKSIGLLKKAVSYNPNLAQAYLLLGRAHCLIGEFDEAVKFSSHYTYLKPDNPLGFIEAGFGYLAMEIGSSRDKVADMCQMDGEQNNKNNFRETAVVLFKESGIDGQQFSELASENYSKGDFQRAACYFQLADSFGSPKIKQGELVQKILMTLSGVQFPENNSTDLPGIKELSDHLLINPDELYWIQPLPAVGKPLDLVMSDNIQVGVMWWNGSAGLPIRVHEPGNFNLSFVAKHSSPPPIELEIELNLKSVEDFSLSKGDLSWQGLETEIYLSRGINLLSINFNNDGKENEIDRNAYIGWIQLDRK